MSARSRWVRLLVSVLAVIASLLSSIDVCALIRLAGRAF
jgi:hypothetical protein